jgi:hypothetical protein
MSNVLIKRMLRLIPIAAVALLVVFGDTRPVAAAECFSELDGCYRRAATRTSFWTMWEGGLDCELTFIDCTRRALIGR